MRCAMRGARQMSPKLSWGEILVYRGHAKLGLGAHSINFGLFLRKAGGMSNLMQTVQNLDLSTAVRNFLRPFSESA